jgi:uncharacterized protein YyaL (SSP411 family)
MSNRLKQEASPYLLQHAENPVDWYPWGVEALNAAAERELPILLSIGYSSCHWCHVMARESFEDPATAAYMNEHFINIKVDREERPDIDAIYLEAAQAMSGHGGWPLTAFLAPDQVPFFAGTYFPKEPRANMPSFMQLMQSVVELWQTNRAAIEERGKLLVDQLKTTAQLAADERPVEAESVTAAIAALSPAYDDLFGGFGGAPKFPPHSVTELLLGSEDPAAREMALQTLRQIAAGGINDQLAGGFCRYSVDRRWDVPHFEKMLYDNALLARAYLHAFQVSKEAVFEDVARATLDWMLDQLHAPGEGFASALDADSADAGGGHAEGAYYAWQLSEARAALDEAVPEHAEQLLGYWGLDGEEDFEGGHVLRIARPEPRPPDAVLQAARAALLSRRALREPPGEDGKRITAWNALAIAALADAGAALEEPRYNAAAVETAELIERELKLADGRLLRSLSGGRPGPPGYLEDHAHCGAAYLTLYERSGETRWFLRAVELAELLLEHFEDAELGGFFSVADDHEALIVRRKDIEDNPIPSGNSAAALLLLRLHALTGEERFFRSATRTLQQVQRVAARLPLGFGCALEAIAFYSGPVQEIALVGPEDQRRELQRAVLEDFRPRSVLATATSSEDSPVPLLAGRAAIDGRAAAYVCRNFACELPVSDPEALVSLLAGQRIGR